MKIPRPQSGLFTIVIIVLIAGFIGSVIFLLNSFKPNDETALKYAPDKIFVGFKETAQAKEIEALEKQFRLERICSPEKKLNNTRVGYYKTVSGKNIESLHEELRKERLKEESPVLFADLDFTLKRECLK